MLGMIPMRREHSETLRVQPTNHSHTEKESGSHSTSLQSPGFQAAGTDVRALNSVQGEVAHALQALQTLINRRWPGCILRDVGQVSDGSTFPLPRRP